MLVVDPKKQGTSLAQFLVGYSDVYKVSFESNLYQVHAWAEPLDHHEGVVAASCQPTR